MRSVRPRQVGPLRQPKIDATTNLVSRHRKLLDIGYAVQPDSTRPHYSPESHRQISRSGTRRNHNIGLLVPNDPDDPSRRFQQRYLGPAVSIIDQIEFVLRHLCAIRLMNRDECDFTIFEGPLNTQKLHPMAAARRDREQFRTNAGRLRRAVIWQRFAAKDRIPEHPRLLKTTRGLQAPTSDRTGQPIEFLASA